MIFHKERRSITLAAGAYSDNTERLGGDLLRQIVTIPGNAGNVYDFRLTSPDGDVIYENTGITGTMNDADLNVPLVGIYTMAILNATVVGDTMTILLVAQDA